MSVDAVRLPESGGAWVVIRLALTGMVYPPTGSAGGLRRMTPRREERIAGAAG